jgi:hypothetical protein
VDCDDENEEEEEEEEHACEGTNTSSEGQDEHSKLEGINGSVKTEEEMEAGMEDEDIFDAAVRFSFFLIFI